jgi:hypothetical protein
MSINKTVQKLVNRLKIIFHQVIDYIYGAAAKIFSPNQDNYPATGVQPYEGDSADQK